MDLVTFIGTDNNRQMQEATESSRSAIDGISYPDMLIVRDYMKSCSCSLDVHCSSSTEFELSKNPIFLEILQTMVDLVANNSTNPGKLRIAYVKEYIPV